MYDAIEEQDGNLVMEFSLTEIALLAALADKDFDGYTCSTIERPFLACLDIASPSTLSGTINDTYQVDSEVDLLQGVTATYIGVDAASTNLFGVNELCGTVNGAGGKVQGDGILDILDLSVLTWIAFRVPPYDLVTPNTFTVNGETDVELRCEDAITRAQWLARYDPELPCDIPRAQPTGRRLERDQSTGEDDLHVHMHLHDVREHGSWFHIRLEDTLIAVELLVNGMDATREVGLKNLRAPFSSTRDDVTHDPFDAHEIEVRYARHVEYVDATDARAAECAVIHGLVAGSAMYRDTIGVGQVPTVREGVAGVLLCPFDLFLYVPGAYDCSVDVTVGSRAMDGKWGRKVRHDTFCDPKPFSFDVYRSQTQGSPPNSPPTSTHPSLPYSPPPSSPPVGSESQRNRLILIVAICTMATLVLCSCALMAVFFLTSEREETPAAAPSVPPRDDLEHNRPTMHRADVIAPRRTITRRGVPREDPMGVVVTRPATTRRDAPAGALPGSSVRPVASTTPVPSTGDPQPPQQQAPRAVAAAGDGGGRGRGVGGGGPPPRLVAGSGAFRRTVGVGGAVRRTIVGGGAPRLVAGAGAPVSPRETPGGRSASEAPVRARIAVGDGDEGETQLRV